MFDQVLLEIGSWSLNFTGALMFGSLVLVFTALYHYGSKYWWPKIDGIHEVKDKQKKSLKRVIKWILFIVFVITSSVILNLDYVFTRSANFDISIILVFKAFLIFQIARLLDWVLVNVFIKKYYSSRGKEVKGSTDKKESFSAAAKIVKYILYATALIVFIRSFDLDIILYPITLAGGKVQNFTLTSVISALLIVLFARLLIWLLTQLILFGIYRRNEVDVGAQYAINQLLKYIIYVIAIYFALDHLGINMTLILGGAAALLVGIGLGLQQSFNDLFSGLVLLFERSVAVGDILEIDGKVGEVKKIGLRSSVVESRKNTSTVVPNSILVNNSVINWTHYNDKVRFDVSVGVAYGSDTALVKEILLNIAKENKHSTNYPPPFVRFNDFGDSALQFTLYFHSTYYKRIEDVKSDLRFEIDKQFRANNISIPFPQRDVWFRNNGPKL